MIYIQARMIIEQDDVIGVSFSHVILMGEPPISVGG